MSEKKEYVKKFLDIAMGWKSVEGLDEILHPEYFGEKYFSDEDLLWMNTSSWTSFLAEKKNQDSFQVLNPDGKGFRPQVGIEAVKMRMERTQDKEILSPKPKLLIHEILEDGDKVMVNYIASFVHDLPYYGIKPTNQKIELNGMYIFTFHEEKIVKIVFMNDTYQLLTKMGEVILGGGDEEQIQQYMEMLKRQNIIPRGVDEKHE